VGGILGAYLGFIPALILVLGLGTYDIISVFVTKHMVKLADQSRLRELPVMFETPSEGIKTGPRPVKGKARKPDVLGLGTGDIAIPIVFFVSLVRQFTFVQVLGAVMGGIVGLGLTIYYVTQVRRAALPALPPIIGFSIIGLGLSFLLPF
jgi:presenilin-like A22 family membrane protease